MLPHQDRVVEEKADLDGKLSKLTAFIHGEVFASLPYPDRELLRDQHMFMRHYSLILGQRIKRFGEPK